MRALLCSSVTLLNTKTTKLLFATGVGYEIFDDADKTRNLRKAQNMCTIFTPQAYPIRENNGNVR